MSTVTSRKKSLSLCMIMKDEEDWLPLCLSSVADFINELVIVDTGSTDNSVKIAEDFGARVFYHPWIDDFSAVRNFSLQQATSDWILVLDADEVLLEQDIRKIHRLIEQDDQSAYLLTQRHYTDDVRLSGFEPCKGEYIKEEGSHKGYFESSLGRLFPNYQGIHYRGAVHELIEFCLEEMPEIKLIHSNIKLHHYGHTANVKKKKDKSKIYTPLGEKKVNLESRGWKEWFELAVEHNNNQRTNESILAFEESLKLFKGYIHTWINYGYVLCEAGRFEEARQALFNAIKLDASAEESFCNLGVVELRERRYLDAIKYFRQALRIKPNYINALRNMSIALVALNRLSEAALVLNRILTLIPNDEQTKISLGSLYLHAGVPIEALKYLSETYERSPRNVELTILIGQALKMCGETVKSLRFLEEHIRSHGNDLPVPELNRLHKFVDQEAVELFLQ